MLQGMSYSCEFVSLHVIEIELNGEAGQEWILADNGFCLVQIGDVAAVAVGRAVGQAGIVVDEDDLAGILLFAAQQLDPFFESFYFLCILHKAFAAARAGEVIRGGEDAAYVRWIAIAAIHAHDHDTFRFMRSVCCSGERVGKSHPQSACSESEE